MLGDNNLNSRYESFRQSNGWDLKPLMNGIIEGIEPFKEVLIHENESDSLKEKFLTLVQQKAESLEVKYGKVPNIKETEVQESLKLAVIDIFSSLSEIQSKEIPDRMAIFTAPVKSPNIDLSAALIRVAGVSEAVFSHAGDDHPILATDSLGPCIGVAGYDPMNKFGFIIHFAIDGEVDRSGSSLMDRIRAYRSGNTNAPLLVHLRGGIKGWSESTLVKIKEWIAAKDLNSIIASENTLKEVSEEFIPGSIRLDIRTGVCEKYDYETNPYSKKIKREEEFSQLNLKKAFASNFTNCINAVVIPKITIVYDSKKIDKD